ncbi:MAG: SusC/RagA family TonB-linked outer membrane protein [Salinivirgaceae bacterium]|jgi:TonB-linked SusC/RagA family outer membrane protein|nr:SusC/RagA family TonB-linked outer membrane protein [Salinivirgaceae bacterium]
MEYYYKPICRFIGIVISFWISICSLNAQNETDDLKQNIAFTKTELSLLEALDEINSSGEINILFSSKADYLKGKIKFSSKSMTIEKAFAEIKKQAPVEIVKSSKHYIVKERKLEKNYKIQGSVIDASTNEKLIAAQVYISGTSKGVVADENGNFELLLKPGVYNIKCRYMGYKEVNQTVNLFENKSIDLRLEVSKKQIQEIKVTDNRRELKSFAIGRPIETIKGKTVAQLNTNDVNDALHGRVNGVWSTKTSGAPGDHGKIRIRGISSIFGSTDPLYVVDGMIIPVINFNTLGIADINTKDVESIVVLKDASSTALYGYLGGNGVVIIETKKGGGETKFNFSVNQGLQHFNKRYSLLNSEQFYNTLELADQNIRTEFYKRDPLNNMETLYPHYIDDEGNTLGYDDFQDEIFRGGNISEYQLSSKGEFKGIHFYMSGNYYKHNGIVTNTNYNKYSFSGNLLKTVGEKFSVNVHYSSCHQENKNNLENYLGNNVIFKGINFEPAFRTTPDTVITQFRRLYYTSSNYVSHSESDDESVNLLDGYKTSPDKLFYENEKKKIENTNSAGINTKYKINDQFSLRANLSASFRNKNFSSYLPKQLSNIEDEKYLRSKENVIILSQQYDAVYKNNLDNHKFDAFIRFRNYNDNIYWNIDSTNNISIDAVQPENDIYVKGSMSMYGEKGSVLRTINSYIANFNYNYKNKYFISLLANSDHLKEGHYVNTKDLFTSLALNYDLANEYIFGFPKWIDHFNLYANIGKSGNYPLNSLSNDLYATDNEYSANNQPVPAVYISNLSNHYLKHEEVNEKNFGTSLSLFKNRIVISADYYQKVNSNLLIMREIPYYYIGGFVFDNVGKMESSGFEFSAQIVPVQSNNMYWSSKFGLSTNKQRIKKLYNGEQISFNRNDILYPEFYAQENEPLGAITGYSYQGKWDEIEEVENAEGNPIYIKHRDLAFLKLDTVRFLSLTEDDKTIIGNSIPKFNLNWINQFQYKNFTFEMLWYGSIGFDKYNATKASTYLTGTNSEVQKIIADSMDFIVYEPFYQSSFFVEDASFIKLKTLSFIYTPQKKIIDRVGMEFKLSFENLITLTRYTGYDPEATTHTNNNYTDNAIDRGSYPNPKGVFFSINLNF